MIPNLPGMMPDKRSWLYRNADGFHSSSIGKSAQNEEEAASAPPTAKSLADIVKDTSPEEERVEVDNRKVKTVLFTEQPKSIGGLLAGGGVFAPASDDLMRTNCMDIGNKVETFTPTVSRSVQLEKMVCRFYGYFVEGRIFSSNEENPIGNPTTEAELVHRLTIHFYLDEEKVEMNEMKSDNSGVWGGGFFKKAPLKKRDGKLVSLQDLHVGNVLDVLGRSIKICDADKMTREYFRRTLNAPLAPAMDMPKPKPPGAEGAALATGLQSHTDTGKEKKVGACSGDYGDRKKQLNKEYKYLHGDARVLKFLAIQIVTDGSDQTMADQMLATQTTYTVSYYLIDDSMDIRLIKTRRSSSTDQTTLLKRGKVPKNDSAFFEPADLRVNGKISFFGRTIQLLDCDATTRAFYEEINMPQPAAHGNEDALSVAGSAKGSASQGSRGGASVRSSRSGKSMPIAPPRDDGGFLAIGAVEQSSGEQRAARMQREEHRGKVLRCNVTLLKEPKRKFSFFYFLEDDTVSVFEEITKNTGMAGSPNFLKRGIYDATIEGVTARATPRIIELGTKVTLNGFEWEVTGADAQTLELCKGMQERFPAFSPRVVAGKLLMTGLQTNSDLRAAMARYDRDKNAWLPAPLFKVAVESEGIFAALSPQEALTITTHFTGPDGNVYYSDMFDLVAQIYFDSEAEPRPVFEASSGRVMNTLLATGRTWRAELRALPRSVRGGKLPISDLQEALAMLDVHVSDQALFTLRYLYGLDPTTNDLCSRELSGLALPGSNTASAASLNVARGSAVQAVKARSLRESTAGAGSAHQNAEAAASEAAALEAANAEIALLVFVDVNKLCDDLFKAAWVM